MPLEFQDRTDAEFTNRTDTEWNEQIMLTVQDGNSISNLENTAVSLSGQQTLTVQDVTSSGISGPIGLETQTDLAFVDTEHAIFQDQPDTTWAGIRNTAAPQDLASGCSLETIILAAYLFIPETISQTDMEGIDWRYLQAGDGNYILTGDGGKIVINQGLTQGHVLTAQGSASSTNTTDMNLSVNIISLSVAGCISSSATQGQLAQQHSLIVQGTTSPTILASVSMPSTHILAVANIASDTLLGILSIPQIHNMVVSESVSASIGDTRSVSVTQANVRLSLADGYAFADIVGVTDFLTAHLGEKLIVFDSSKRKISGYTKASGTGEAYGDELITGWTNYALSFGYFNSTGKDLISVWDNTGLGLAFTNALPTISAGGLIKRDTNLTLNSGDRPTSQTFHNVFEEDCEEPHLYSPSEMVSGANTVYRTIPATGFSTQRLTVETSGATNFFSTFSMKQVTAPSATGVTVVSLLGGSSYNWEIETGFNYNDPAGYTFTIGQMELSQAQQVVLQEPISASKTDLIYTADSPLLSLGDALSATVLDPALLDQRHAIDISNLASTTEINQVDLYVREKDLILSEPISPSGMNVLDLVKQGSLILQDAASPSQIDQFSTHRTVHSILQEAISTSNAESLEFVIDYLGVSGVKSSSSTDIIDLTQGQMLELSDMNSATVPGNIPLDLNLWGDLNVIFAGMGSKIKFHGHKSEVKFEAIASQILFRAKRGIYK
jgi:hypothetical protein